ncbi:heavy metal-associated isoprenylated plant protein 4 [Capsicum galapagoense]
MLRGLSCLKKRKFEVINAVYKVRFHCQKCAHDIRKSLLRMQGVRTVDVKFEKDEVTVKGAIDTKKIHQRLEKWDKKKVEIVSQAKVKEVQKETIKETILKVYMHCKKCELDLKRKLLKHKGIHNVKTDFKTQTIIVETILELEKVVTYVTNKFGKHAEIVKKKEEETKEVLEEVTTEGENIKKNY